MTYKFELERSKKVLTLADLNDCELAIVVGGPFNGELFYKDISGLHSISGNRYWPSEYIQSKAGDGVGSYCGPLSSNCSRIVPGDIIKVRE